MIQAKLIEKRTSNMRYPITNYLYLNTEKKVICFNCSKPINDKDYVRLCMDLNKIWHDTCYEKNRDHGKSKFDIKHNQQIHNDFLCFLNYTTADIFTAFQTNIIKTDLLTE